MTGYPPYRVETPRLVIRCWEPSDAGLFHKAITSSIDHLRTHMPFIAKEPLQIEDRIELLRKFRSSFDASKDFTYGIFDKEEKKVLGSTGLHTRPGKYGFEIGYWVVDDECNKGIATEATSALVSVGFNVNNIDRIEIHCNPNNEYSRKIPEKLGFTCECIRRRYNSGFSGEFRDSMIWVLFKDEYIKYGKQAKIVAYDPIGREIELTN